jgi:site-specific DNA-adenine methylase
MSIKKELLSQLNVQQLKKLAEKKGISFSLNKTQEEYYSEWSEKDLMIDLMNDNRDISIHEIEEQIKVRKK